MLSFAIQFICILMGIGNECAMNSCVKLISVILMAMFTPQIGHVSGWVLPHLVVMS